jgi:hypothetical protein
MDLVLPHKTERLDAESGVRHCKSLSQAGRAFRSLKTVDLKARSPSSLEWSGPRPIVPCPFAHSVEPHLKEAWREPLFTDEGQAPVDCDVGILPDAHEVRRGRIEGGKGTRVEIP